MVLDSALQGHAAGAKELLAAVTKDPSLLEDPSLAFLKEFCENYPPAAPEPETDDDAGGEFMKREKTPFPAVPTNAAEAPDDADWSIASTKKSAAQQASTPAERDLEADKLQQSVRMLTQRLAETQDSLRTKVEQIRWLKEMTKDHARARGPAGRVLREHRAPCRAADKVRRARARAPSTRGPCPPPPRPS